MKNLSLFRRKKNRCASMKSEPPRSWRCQLVVGHDGKHTSVSGHRTWQ